VSRAFEPTDLASKTSTPTLRKECIDVLRGRLTRIVGTEASLCRVAAERGIFCRGFRRWHIAEFDRRWRGAIGRSTHLSRAQMERFADLWQLTEQVSRGISLACDAAGAIGSPCRGWDEFSDEDLARFCRELDEPTATNIRQGEADDAIRVALS
jgi:hypothetical protein